MAGRVGTGLAVILTAIVTAALTSAVWLLIFNLQEDGAAPAPKPAPAAPAPAAPIAPPAPATAAAPAAPLEPAEGDVAALVEKRLTIPVPGVAPAQLSDMFGDARGGGARAHQALDIMAARGTPVVAVENGRIAKLFTSDAGGLTIYQFDPTEPYSYYYAHLDRYAEGLKEGQPIERGQIIGYVGTTGNANPDGPHLHFAIFRLGASKNWSEGTPLNPYRPLIGQ